MEGEKKNTSSWMDGYKKPFIISGICCATVLTACLGVQHKEVLMEFWNTIQEEIKNGTKYSTRWFKNISDTELVKERERVRLEYCASGTDSSKASGLESLLSLFDVEKSRRDWGKKTPHVTNIPREHGRYLRNDD